MKKSFKILAAALAAITAMSCTSATAFADKFKTVDGVTYLYSDTGSQKGKYTGWAKAKSGAKYYYKDGVKLKNKWLKVKGKKTYYLQSNGKMAIGDVYFSNGRIYHFDDKGKLVYGIQLTVDNITQKGLTEHLKGLVLNDDDLHIYSNYEFRVEKRDNEGKWISIPYRDPEDYVDWPDALEDYFHDENDGDFSENKSWTGMYGKLETGEYRYVKKYFISSASKIIYSGEIYSNFIVPEKRSFTVDELKAVYDHLDNHKEEYGIGDVYIDYENNCVIAIIENPLKGYYYSDYLRSLSDTDILKSVRS